MEAQLDATHRSQRLKDEHTVPSTRGTMQHQPRLKIFIPGGKSNAGKPRRSRAFFVILDALINEGGHAVGLNNGYDKRIGTQK